MTITEGGRCWPSLLLQKELDFARNKRYNQIITNECSCNCLLLQFRIPKKYTYRLFEKGQLYLHLYLAQTKTIEISKNKRENEKTEQDKAAI